MWWLFGLVVVAGLGYTALTRSYTRRFIVLAAVFGLCLLALTLALNYLNMLYAAAPKGVTGEVILTVELADRIRDTTAILYSSVIGLISSLVFALWYMWQYVSERRWF